MCVYVYLYVEMYWSSMCTPENSDSTRRENRSSFPRWSCSGRVTIWLSTSPQRKGEMAECIVMLLHDCMSLMVILVPMGIFVIARSFHQQRYLYVVSPLSPAVLDSPTLPTPQWRNTPPMPLDTTNMDMAMKATPTIQSRLRLPMVRAWMSVGITL